MTEKHTPGPMTPEKATKIYWKLWKKHYKPDWTPGLGYEHPVYLDDYNTGESYMKMYIEFMGKFLTLVSSAPALAAENRALRDNNRELVKALERMKSFGRCSHETLRALQLSGVANTDRDQYWTDLDEAKIADKALENNRKLKEKEITTNEQS